MTEEEHPELKLRKVMSNLNFDLDEVKEIADEYDSLHNPELFGDIVRYMAYETGTLYGNKKWKSIHSRLVSHRLSQSELTCETCKKSASWNTPWMDKEGHIMCDTCADEDVSDKLWYGIDQRQQVKTDTPFKMDPQRMYYRYKSVILHVYQNYHVQVFHKGGKRLRFYVWEPTFNYSCWIKNGHQAFPLTKNEQRVHVTELLPAIWELYCQGTMFRCTTCGGDFDGNPAGFPLFAGACCEDCMVKHKEHLDQQRKEGHVCRNCGQPYGNCCC